MKISLLNKKQFLWDDIFMGGMAVLSAIITILSFSKSLEINLEYKNILLVVDLVIGGIFLLEFILKLSVAHSKKVFLKNNWWMLFAVVPVMSTTTFGLIPVYIVRFIRVTRFFRLALSVKEISDYKHGFLEQTHIGYVFVLWIVTVFSGAVMFHSFEYGINTTIHNFFDSFWWAIVTVSTIGYGDIFPVTAAGRIVGVLLILAGIGITGVSTALIASFFVRHQK